MYNHQDYVIMALQLQTTILHQKSTNTSLKTVYFVRKRQKDARKDAKNNSYFDKKINILLASFQQKSSFSTLLSESICDTRIECLMHILIKPNAELQHCRRYQRQASQVQGQKQTEFQTFLNSNYTLYYGFRNTYAKSARLCHYCTTCFVSCLSLLGKKTRGKTGMTL